MNPHPVRLGGDKIIYVEIIGDTDKAKADDMGARIEQILNEHAGEEISGIVDISRGGIPTTEAQQVFIKLMSDPRVGKVAFVGTADIPRVFAEFVVKFARRDAVQYFKDIEEAKQWLNPASP